MSWRPNDEWPDGLIVPNPRDVEASLVVAAKDTGPLMPGPGRRMRKLGRTAAVVVQIALLSFMVLAPSGTFAGKPTSDPTASTQTDAKGKAADAKAKKGSTDTQTAPTTDAKGGRRRTPARRPRATAAPRTRPRRATQTSPTRATRARTRRPRGRCRDDRRRRRVRRADHRQRQGRLSARAARSS